ncbi:MAG TPA: Holliday junction branch migration protein RuvA [Kiritimatiellia bacterium]|nr:Holliday junction branch migration protein RuvA [Kiritimatiellia bacterium]HPA77190.1 Holliday junction branch migration protein RuvA [Kiritimatiellia bacterium]
MIAFLEGKLVVKNPTRIVLDVHGVGYEVLIPLSSCDPLPAPGQTCRILTYHHVREDAHILFGFVTEAERELFVRLLAVNGVGPKLALSALSSLSVRDFKRAVLERDVKRLSSISGVGKKTAERLVVELSDKFGEGEAAEALAGETGKPVSRNARDAMMALIALGYKQMDATKMVGRVPAEEATTVEEIVRRALTG